MTEVTETELYSADVLPKDLRTQAELVCAAAYSADGVEPLAEQAQELIRDEFTDGLWHSWVLDAGKLVAYGNVDARRISAIELVVHPLYRRQQYGTAILASLLQHLSDAAAKVPDKHIPDTLDPRPMVWSHGDLPAAQQLAQKFGLERTRELLKMHCPVADLVVNLPDLPEGIELRTLAEADSLWGDDELNRWIVEVNNVAFSWHPEQSGWTVDDVLDHRAQEWFDPQECFVAVDSTSHRLLGFAWTKTHYPLDETNRPVAGAAPSAGELYLVAVDPSAQGKRIGTVLTSLVLRRLAARGIPTLILYVEGNNEAALRVYEKSGFTVECCDVAYRYNKPKTA